MDCRVKPGNDGRRRHENAADPHGVCRNPVESSPVSPGKWCGNSAQAHNNVSGSAVANLFFESDAGLILALLVVAIVAMGILSTAASHVTLRGRR
jgi:hypothetical protein